MNKPLVERIENRARHGATGSIAESDLQSILADVRELVEAAKGFVVEADPAHHDDQLVTPQRSLSAGHYRRLSAILRKVGGE